MPSPPAHRLVFLAGLLLASLSGAFASPIAPAEVASAPEADVLARLPDSLPAAYFAYAERLWFEARRDESVVWLYVAQIRYRFFLAANPRLATAGESAKFQQLTDTVGEPIERYAGANLPRWRAQLATALAWDQANPNGCTSQKRFASQWEDARNVLANLTLYLHRHAFEFNKQREQDGIGDVGLTSPEGPYIDIRKPQMPHDWPVLLSHTSFPMLTGYYAIDDPAFAALFLPNDPAALAGVNNLQFDADGDDRHFLVTARRDRTFLCETRISVSEEDDAVVFTREIAGAAAGLSQGATVVRYRMRRNEIGDLVVQADALTDGMFPGHKFQVRLDITKWYRAERLAPGDEPGR